MERKSIEKQHKLQRKEYSELFSSSNKHFDRIKNDLENPIKFSCFVLGDLSVTINAQNGFVLPDK